MNSLLDQAARVLEHQPTRSMEAEPLLRKAARESGVSVPFPRFLAALRQQKERFAVIEPDPVAGLAERWDPRHRSMYRAALEAAGVAQPIVLLTERLVDPPDADGSPAGDTVTDVFGDVHDALMHLLRTTEAEDTLYDAVVVAVEELHVLRRLAAPASLNGGAV